MYSALANMMSNVVMNEFSQSVCKLKQLPDVGPRTHVEPTNRLPLIDDVDVQSLMYNIMARRGLLDCRALLEARWCLIGV